MQNLNSNSQRVTLVIVFGVRGYVFDLGIGQPLERGRATKVKIINLGRLKRMPKSVNFQIGNIRGGGAAKGVLPNYVRAYASGGATLFLL